MAPLDEIQNRLRNAGICITRPRESQVDTSVTVADYVKDFEWLWDLTTGVQPRNAFSSWLESRNDQDAALIIVWSLDNGMPECDPRIVCHHVTAFDWVLSASCALLGRAKIPRLRIIVVDEYSHNLKYQGAFAVDAVDLLDAAMPWFKVVTSSEYQAFLASLSNGTWREIHDLWDAGAQRRSAVESLKFAWQGMAASVGDAHSISNLLGPMVLNEVYGGAQSFQMKNTRHALLKLVERYGLVPRGWGRRAFLRSRSGSSSFLLSNPGGREA